MGLDPNYLYDNADVIWYGTEGYSNALNALMQVSGKSETAVEAMLNAKYGAADYWTAVEALKDKGVVTAYNTNGYRCFAYASDVTMTAPSGAISAIDSNATSTAIVKANPVYDVIVDSVPESPTYEKVLTNPLGSTLSPNHGFYGWKFFAGEAVQAIGAAGTGISLGKTIDSILYNANPDFWDSHGMSSLNPQTWNSITNGDDSFAAGLFNMVFGLDPNTGKGQMFIDENALAYLAAYMNAQGAFNEAGIVIDEHTDIEGIDTSFVEYPEVAKLPVSFLTSTEIVTISSDVECLFLGAYVNSRRADSYIASKENCVLTVTRTNISTGATTVNSYTHTVQSNLMHDVYSRFPNNMPPASANDLYMPSFSPQLNPALPCTSSSLPMGSSSQWEANFNSEYGVGSAISYPAVKAYLYTNLYYGTEETPVDGIGTQPNATVPDTTGWDDYDNILPSLQQQYPDLWDNAVPNTIVQPDGSTKTIVYVPIAMPNANGQWDTQPTSSTTSQADPQVQPQTNPTPQNNDLLKLLLQQITMPQPNPETDPQTQTQPQPNIPTPTTTGTGDTPTPVPPIGNASALWSVYHPTQAQVNDFGAWLWTDNIIQRIQQILQNPMEGIITLHKVFGMPVDSGQGTIVVGRLDSNVPSATVTQQYITVDCGSVNCSEEFGTVFDYPPYTEISLYLPFIGIVPLNVNDIMRSQIHITYGIDVFTGACLAMVEVTRDANVVNMYQYSGVASVEYPLTGSIHTGLITGLLGAAGGIAMLATGGAATPVVGLLGAAGSAFSAGKQSQGRAGGFSGNAGAMGIKNPYLIIERPQVKTAETFPNLAGFPTNYSVKLGECEGHVVVSHVHVEGINATQSELIEIENLLTSGVVV